MQIPILNGIGEKLRPRYPLNRLPVPSKNGISNGFLRPADGIATFATGVGADRGGINWNGTLYRVSGASLVKVSELGTVTDLGAIPGADDVSITYGFDRMGIAASGSLYYFDGTALTMVTDPDLGTVNDVAWLGGYYVTTDGTSIVITELGDPTSVSPYKYGSSEADPDPIIALKVLRNELKAINRYTIETFDNVGGSYFPFQRVDGAQITKGACGRNACCIYLDAIAILGSGRNEAPSVYICTNGQAVKLSTVEIDRVLSGYTEDQLSKSILETRNSDGNDYLYIHLPDKTFVFDATTSKTVGEPAWVELSSSAIGRGEYRAKHFVWAYGKWIVGDKWSNLIGSCTDSVGSHHGLHVAWEFSTTIIYNASRGALFNELELVALTGDVALADNPIISTSYSLDGETWSQERPRRAGAIGDRAKRLVWYQQGSMRNWRIQRFRGDSKSHLTFARLEAQLEPLNV